jgi:hypothetical protein
MLGELASADYIPLIISGKMVTKRGVEDCQLAPRINLAGISANPEKK